MSEPTQIFKLTAGERDSAVWQRIKAEIERDLSVMRVQNDGDKSAEETAKLRGRIAQAKKLLGYENIPTITPTD
jgi:hypothetical protein